MNSSPIEHWPALAVRVSFSDDALTVALSDGRTIAVPFTWYPRLAHATAPERSNWRLIGRGEGIHWPDLDEDVSIEQLLAGTPSAESEHSFARWRANRQ